MEISCKADEDECPSKESQMEMEQTRDPLRIELILDRLFGCLNVENIKVFRLVCRSWNNVSIPYIKERVIITFNGPSSGSLTVNSPKTFLELFKNSDTGTDFTAFKFIPLTDKEEDWKPEEIGQVLEDLRPTMKELTIGDVSTEAFNISSYFGSRLSKLNMMCTRKTPTLTVSANKIASTQFLNLQNCILEVSDDVKMVPVSLNLDTLLFMKTGEDGHINVGLNEFVDFKNLKELTIIDGRNEQRRCCKSVHYLDENISMHFRESVSVGSVHLFRVLADFRDAIWKISGKMYLEMIDLVEENQMEVAELEFKGAKLNYDSLPKNIKKLTLLPETRIVPEEEYPSENSDFEEPPPRLGPRKRISLDNLNYLHLHGTTREPPLLVQQIFNFTDCYNLTVVKLTNEWGKSRLYKVRNDPAVLDVDTFPKSIKQLFICGNVKIKKGTTFHLEKLSIQRCPWSSTVTFLSKFKGNELAVDAKEDSFNTAKAGVMKIMEKITQGKFESIYLAFPKEDNLEKFETSSLFKRVDKPSRFYHFENGNGKAIDESHFEERLNSENDSE